MNSNNTATVDNNQELGIEITGRRGARALPFPVATLIGFPFSRHSAPNRFPALTPKTIRLDSPIDAN